MIYIIHFGSAKTPHIGTMLSSIGFENKIVDWQENNIPFDKATGIILSGSPTMLTDADHRPYHEKYSFLKKLDIPVLGICFGHQVLGILHGAKIFRGEELNKSITIRILKKDPLFEGLQISTTFVESHVEGINLPENFIHLASSDTYEIEAMKHPSKDIYGVQFHPEVSGVNGRILLGNFGKRCG